MRTLAPFFIVLLGCSSCAPSSQSESNGPPSQAASDQRGGSITEREKDSIRGQIAENWVLDIGIPGLEKMVAQIDVEMNPDGSVQSVAIDRSHYNGDPNWERFAESCRRAVLKSSPLRMPVNRSYEQWKQMRLIFNAHDMLQQ